MGDFNFIKHYVCYNYKWNPFSEEVKRIPEHYWYTAFTFVRLGLKNDWEHFFKPNAELTASIAMPENYKLYAEYQQKVSAQIKKGESVDTQVGDRKMAISNSRYDPMKGLVDANGNVLIPKERFDKMNGFSGGVAISV